MTGNLFMAIGTRRSRAERWIRELSERFPDQDIRLITRGSLAELETIDPDAKDGPEIVRVDETPYTDLAIFREDVRQATDRGWEVFLEYFPAEPIIQLIQNDQNSGEALVGAEKLREELRALLPESVYLQELETNHIQRHPALQPENRGFARGRFDAKSSIDLD